ncbi:MAG: ABC transporter ATP-binding protein, partial [Thermodesulfobacteriota bacterium]|nr:ABC transporter ATP-binding protein [Thermodesulfobacteriota bacterium]
MSKEKAVVEISDVDFAYDGELILEGISLTVGEHDFLGVVGPNGSGKTTLLRLILGLIRPLRGQVRVFGRAPERARHLVSYVPQHANLDGSFPVSVMDVVLMGRLGKAPILGRFRNSDRKAADEAMEKAEIYDLRDHHFGTLSGGQKQRVLMARALVGKPELLLLDEPTASIDGRVEQDIYELLKKLNDKVAIVLVSHDLGFISTYVNRVACVNRRLVCNPTQQITGDVMEACYSGPVHMLKHTC